MVSCKCPTLHEKPSAILPFEAARLFLFPGGTLIANYLIAGCYLTELSSYSDRAVDRPANRR